MFDSRQCFDYNDLSNATGTLLQGGVGAALGCARVQGHTAL
jgi:hypothetical protein